RRFLGTYVRFERPGLPPEPAGTSRNQPEPRRSAAESPAVPHSPMSWILKQTANGPPCLHPVRHRRTRQPGTGRKPEPRFRYAPIMDETTHAAMSSARAVQAAALESQRLTGERTLALMALRFCRAG